jgi:arylsulfatase A-like enzyme
VLISVDTLRPDHLGAYGYARATSPRLDALGRQGAVFENAFTPSPWTLPSHTSMLTGLYPSHHGLTNHDLRLADGTVSLASLLDAAGFATAAYVNCHNLSERYDFDDGFDDFLYVRERADSIAPSRLITDRAIRWLDAHRGEPTFVFLHYYDVHSDYRSYDEFETLFRSHYEGIADGTTDQMLAHRRGEVAMDARDVAHLVDLYDAGIRQMDTELGRLLDFLDEEGLADETLLLLTSDHGEEFLEHGQLLHGRTQYEEVLRIPLLVRGPGVPAGLRIETTVSLIDLLPTVLATVGAPLLASADGVDLSPLWRGKNDLATRVLFGEADHYRNQHDETRSVRRGRFKLIYNRATRERSLYDLETDPGERRDLAAEHPELAQALMAGLREFMAGQVESNTGSVLSDEDIEHLRSLGYVND